MRMGEEDGGGCTPPELPPRPPHLLPLSPPPRPLLQPAPTEQCDTRPPMSRAGHHTVVLTPHTEICGAHPSVWFSLYNTRRTLPRNLPHSPGHNHLSSLLPDHSYLPT